MQQEKEIEEIVKNQKTKIATIKSRMLFVIVTFSVLLVALMSYLEIYQSQADVGIVYILSYVVSCGFFAFYAVKIGRMIKN